MIKLASITPVDDFDLSLEGSGPIMLLTHLVHKYPEYTKRARRYKGYKILDNSLIELGAALELKTVLDAATKVDADEIILPDVFKDAERTLKAVRKALEELKEFYKNNPGAKKYKIMAVAQGATLYDFKQCFRAFSDDYPEVDVIGVPKAVKERADLKDLYNSSNKEIHFLGCPESLDELKKMGDLVHRIRSIDTCIPALNSGFTDDAWAKRPIDRTINLEKDRVNRTNYKKIMDEVNNFFTLTSYYRVLQQNIRIYLAGPLFTKEEQEQRHAEAQALRALGFTVYNPIELNDSGIRDPKVFFEEDLRAMHEASVCVLRADNYDSGTMVELGYFLSKGTPVMTVWTDFRSEKPANAFVAGATTHGRNRLFREFNIKVISEAILKAVSRDEDECN